MLTNGDTAGYKPSLRASSPGVKSGSEPVKIRNSLKSARLRERSCVIVRRRGRLYVINKKQPKFKTRQG